MPNLENLQRDYARLLIEKGVCLRPGQTLTLKCQAEDAWFARLCAEAAYNAGCREVVMDWRDEALTRLRFLHADDAVFDETPRWYVEMQNSLADGGAAALSILSGDPEALSGVDQDRLRRSGLAQGKALKHVREVYQNNRAPWCVAAIPSPAWAKKVFPALSPDAAVERLWKEILKAARADGGRAAVEWTAHTEALREHIRVLNGYDFRLLRYRNSLGTDLVVELPEGHVWCGGLETCVTTGAVFTPNIPTEEVFTAPKRDGVNGVVVASKPLSLPGEVAEGFRFTLKDGKIVEIHAEKGEASLRDEIAMDEGASYLGEVALVPWDSPISQSGVLFYNTLFDENASCHFAFGSAFSTCIAGGDAMDEDELLARGLNRSMNHVDFMIGTPDLSIVGTTRDGREITVFKDGSFAF